MQIKFDVNKLVRTHKKQKWNDSNIAYKTKELKEEEFLCALYDKLIQQVCEAKDAPSKEKRISELASVLCAVEQIAKASGIDMNEVTEEQIKKDTEKGQFEMFVECIEMKEDNKFFEHYASKLKKYPISAIKKD